VQAEQHKKPASAALYVKTGLCVVGAIFGGILLWSAIAPIHGAVIASGQVVVESNRKAIQHLEGGVIREILVREGQLVEEDELLVRMDSTVNAARLSLIDGQLAELYARRARLTAERDAAAEVNQPNGLESVLARTDFPSIYNGQINLFQARRATRTRQVSLLEERIVQQDKRMGGITAQSRSITSQSRLIRDELESVRSLYEKGFAPLTRVRALERESERLSGEKGSLTASLAEADSVIAEARLEIERLHETVREEAITELRAVEATVAEMEERRIAAADALTRTNIKAPQAGRVIGLSVHTLGGVIAAGAPLMEIVPQGDRLEIAARVSPQDVEKVHAGQEAVVRFSSFSARMTPEADGVVRFVSPDSLVDPVTGAAYYLVMIDLPEPDKLGEVLRGAPLVPGMPTEAFIKTGKQPAINFLLRPLTDALSRSLREE